MIKTAIFGAGGCRTDFPKIIGDNPHLATVFAVTEPCDAHGKAIQEKHGIAEANCFPGWREFVAADRLCNAVIIATMDQDQVGPAVACMYKGYHMLLEKPMAVRLESSFANSPQEIRRPLK